LQTGCISCHPTNNTFLHKAACHAFHLFFTGHNLQSSNYGTFFQSLQHVLCDDAVEIRFVSHIVLYNLN